MTLIYGVVSQRAYI